MGMRINYARQHQLAFSINDLIGFGLNILGEPDNHTFVNQNVSQHLSVALRNVGIFNDQFITHEYTPLL
ncbi:hypothetical protein D3C73_1413560 [compost metagenome]